MRRLPAVSSCALVIINARACCRWDDCSDSRMDVSSPPSIRVSHHRRYPSPAPHSPLSPPFASTASPMSIPSSVRASPSAPPPLPPPRNIEELSLGQEPGWQWGINPNWVEFGKAVSVKPGSSLLGGKHQYRACEEHENTQEDANVHDAMDDARRGSSISTIMPAHRDSAEAIEGSATPSDDDGTSSRPSSNYRYVWTIHTAMLDNSQLYSCPATVTDPAINLGYRASANLSSAR